jgi:hypothetical protein
MKPWREEDLSMILDKGPRNRQWTSAGAAATPCVMAETLWAHPKLGALATHACTAKVMAKAFLNVQSLHPRRSWSSELDEMASLIVPPILNDYMKQRGIDELTHEQCRRVTSSVFHILQEVQGEMDKIPTLVEEEVDKVPTLIGLSEEEVPVAQSFLQYNEMVPYYERRRDSAHAPIITVTPALELVLFAMMGLPTTLMARWKSMEQVAAFYAVRQSILRCMKRFAEDVTTGYGQENALENLNLCLKKEDPGNLFKARLRLQRFGMFR